MSAMKIISNVKTTLKTSEFWYTAHKMLLVLSLSGFELLPCKCARYNQEYGGKESNHLPQVQGFTVLVQLQKQSRFPKIKYLRVDSRAFLCCFFYLG